MHRCLILFLLPSQSQADSGKMDHGYCGEAELLWLLAIQLHHMFSGSPSHVLQSVTSPGEKDGAAARRVPQPCIPSRCCLPLLSPATASDHLPDCLSCHTPVAFAVACIPSRKHSSQQMLANAGSVGEILVKSRFQWVFLNIYMYTRCSYSIWGLSQEVARIGKVFKSI